MSMTYVSMSAGSLLWHTAVAAGVGFVAGAGAYALYRELHPEAPVEEAVKYAAKKADAELNKIKKVIDFSKGVAQLK